METFACQACGEIHDRNERARVRSLGATTAEAYEYVCRECVESSNYVCCDASCGALFPDIDSVNTAQGDTLCGVCRENGTWEECDQCEAWFNSRYYSYCCEPEHDYDDDGCSCPDCRDSSSPYIHNYSYRPPLNFLSVGNGDVIMRRDRYGHQRDRTPYMGFELEVEVKHGTVQRAAEKLLSGPIANDVYLKEDSSISYGFEIVTHPMTLDYALTQFDFSTLRDLRLKGMLSAESNCGLHVHVSRAGFTSPAHEYRWLLFIYRNQEIFEALAERKSSYARFDLSHRATFADLARGKTPAYADRYAAVNTENEHTLEVRLFSSTLFVNRIKSALQLVNGTVEYTRSLASAKVIADGGFSFAEFMAWMRPQGDRYVHLLRRIDEGLNVSRDQAWTRKGEAYRPPRQAEAYWMSHNRTTVSKNFISQEKASL